MTERLALLIANASAQQPAACVTPLVHALVARALDAEVEIHFAGPAVRLLVKDLADRLYPTPTKEKSLGEFLREAASEGARLYACAMAVANWIENGESLLPECRTTGATAFVSRALDPQWRVLCY